MMRSFFIGAVVFFTLSADAKSAANPDLKIPEILDAAALKDGGGGGVAVDPCQDFYQFACGRWIDNTTIPADKERVSHQSTALIDQTDKRLNDLILALEKERLPPTKASRHIINYYRSCMGFAKFTSNALARLKDSWAEVNRITDKRQLTQVLAKLQMTGTSAFFSFDSGQDFKDSNAVIGFLDQDGMALHEPGFYFDQDAKAKEIRRRYIQHITKLMHLAGQTSIEAAASAKQALAIETQLATKAYTFDQRDNPSKVNHPITRAELAELAPALDWEVYFHAVMAPPSRLNVNEPGFFKNMSDVITNTSLAGLKTYLLWQIVHRTASEIGPAFAQEDFVFWDKYLHGAKSLKPRWQICTREVEAKLGYALAEVYVPVNAAAIRGKVGAMITWIKQTFREDLQDLTSGKEAWLDQATEAAAERKLARLGQKIGAPEKWRDYTALTTEPDSFFLNDINIVEFEAKRDMAKIGKPMDRAEWYMMPWEINAYYDAGKNEFVFPFGILQPPSLDARASDGANLGSFGGGTIGHELTHGFDNDGRQYDAEGNIKDWWTRATSERFEAKAQCFVKQANAYKINSVNLNVDGTKTLTENLADQGGVKLGYEALLRVQADKQRSPSALWFGKYNERQQYWIAYAQSWCGKARPEALRQQIKTNPHPPEEFRVNGVVMNRPEFARDFACKEGDPMAPKVRCSLW